MVEHRDSLQGMQLEEEGSDTRRSQNATSEPTQNTDLERLSRTTSRSKETDLGQLYIKEAKQVVFKKGSPVFLLAFTKHRSKTGLNQNYYLCEGIVVEEPSPHTKAPHKVQIVKVTYGFSKKDCSEEDGRTLLNRIIHVGSDQLKAEIPILFAKSKWWI